MHIRRSTNGIFIGLFACLGIMTWLCGVMSLYTGWEILPPFEVASVVGSQLMLSTCSSSLKPYSQSAMCLKPRILFQINHTQEVCAMIDHPHSELLTSPNTAQLELYRQEQFPLHSAHFIYHSPLVWSLIPSERHDLPLCYYATHDMKGYQDDLRQRTYEYQLLAYGGTFLIFLMYKHLRVLLNYQK